MKRVLSVLFVANLGLVFISTFYLPLGVTGLCLVLEFVLGCMYIDEYENTEYEIGE